MRQYRSVVCFKKSTVMSNSVRLSAQLIIVTGLSGSGKSIAIRQLEDSGYYCLDNLPADFCKVSSRIWRNTGSKNSPYPSMLAVR